MKKALFSCIILLAAGILISGIAVSQEKTTAGDTKVSKKFLTTWKKVGNKTKEIRSFKTEKATTVAGVRGAEAEDEAMKFLYFKGGVKYPSRLELKNAVKILEEFVKENPKDETILESKYFIGQCYQQLGENDKAKTAYEDIVNNHPKTDFAKYAKDDLDKMKKK